jgi:hypothetical protein
MGDVHLMESTIYDIRKKIEWDNKNVHDFEMEKAQRIGKLKKAKERRAY